MLCQLPGHVHDGGQVAFIGGGDEHLLLAALGEEAGIVHGSVAFLDHGDGRRVFVDEPVVKEVLVDLELFAEAALADLKELAECKEIPVEERYDLD